MSQSLCIAIGEAKVTKLELTTGCFTIHIETFNMTRALTCVSPALSFPAWEADSGHSKARDTVKLCHILQMVAQASFDQLDTALLVIRRAA